MTEEKKTKIYIIAAVIAALLLLIGGFFIGRATVKNRTVTKIEYVELDPIHDTITDLKPYKVIYPADTANIIKKCVKDGIYSELFPEKDVTKYIEVTREDSSAILADWAAKRYYKATIFDIDTVGKCEMTTEIQYNRLDSFYYEFTPIQKNVTVTKYTTKKISPFIGVGMDVNGINKTVTADVDAEVGLFFKEKAGVALDYRYDFLNNSHSVGGKLLYKFPPTEWLLFKKS